MKCDVLANKALTACSVWTFLFTSSVLCGVPILHWIINQECNLHCRLSIYILCFGYIALLITVCMYLIKGVGAKRRTYLVRLTVLGIVNAIAGILLGTFFIFWFTASDITTSDIILLSNGIIQIYTLFLVILSFLVFELRIE